MSSARENTLLRNISVNLWQLGSPLVKTFDLRNPALGNHCLRVAYLSMRLAEELAIPSEILDKQDRLTPAEPSRRRRERPSGSTRRSGKP